jgi:F-type H+-transporting ATPase subunit alpha
MAELTISAADITAALTKSLEGFEPSLEAKTVGRVTEVGDGIARVAGLPDAAVNELLEFEDGTVGLALNLEEESIGAVVLGGAEGIEEGQTVRSTGRILAVPVGDAMLGRVVNALGEPVDGKGPIVGGIERRVEIQAPGVMGRKPVHEPLQTGIKAIDAMIPIGRGQRELIIGDRKTGKTTVAVDTILNQKGQGVKCIYVAIGQKGSTVANTVEILRQHGAMDYTVVVTAPAADPAPFKYLAPYAGCAMGQHWMESGEHALVVYDDLSKQAEAYRQLSLLLRRPPTPHPSSTWRRTPGAPWVSTGWRAASTPSWSTTICPSRPRPTASCPSFCAGRRAARPTPATSSTSTAVSWSGRPSCPTSGGQVR